MFLYLYRYNYGVSMFNLIHKFIYWFLSVQEKFLMKKVGKNLRTSYSNSTSKVVLGKAASANFSIETEKNKGKLKMGVENILKKYENNPQKLLDFVEKSGTKVYKIPFAKQILKTIGYEVGLIGGLNGISALYINILTTFLANEKIKLSFSTEPMFIFDNSRVDSFTLIQQFHKWYAMKLNLPGFDSKAQENLQKYLNPSNSVKSLSIEEILGLKEAIARDKEAIDFVINIAKSTECSKSAMQKLITGGASV